MSQVFWTVNQAHVVRFYARAAPGGVMKNYALRTKSSVGTKLLDARGNSFRMNGVELDLYSKHPLFER